MKLEVGMYVRTNDGIDKIVEIKEANNDLDKYHIVTEKNEMAFGYLAINKTIFIKDNLIDLIEIGDYVNGEKVTWKNKKESRITLGDDSEYDTSISNESIKSIVTKEQFKSMEYVVKE